MEQRDDTISAARREGFVGRHLERSFLSNWCQRPAAATQVVAITGIGGIGKSTLLEILLEDARLYGASTAWVDGRTGFGTPQGFMACLPPELTLWLTAPEADPGAKWVIGIDNYEALASLDGWLRHVFLGRAPAAHLLVLVCARRFPLEAWRLDPGWAPRVLQWSLTPFTPAEIQDYLSRRGVAWSSSALAPNVAGTPLAWALYADLCHRGIARRDWAGCISERMSARLLREVIDESWHEAINVLCLVSEAHLDFLQAVCDRPPSTAVYQQLSELSFVSRTPRGLRLHDLARPELLRDWRSRQPEQFLALRERVVMRLWRQWQHEPDPAVAAKMARDFVNLVGQQLDSWRDYADLTELAPGLEVTPYQPSDRAVALQLFAEWGRQPIPVSLSGQAALFDDIVRSFPQSVVVIRDAQGQPVVVVSALWLHAGALDILQAHAPEFIDKLFGHPTLDVTRQTLEAGDTIVAALVGVTHHHPQYSAPVLLGTMLRHTLAVTSGQRVLVLVSDQSFQSLLEQLGFAGYPFPLLADDQSEILYSLDLRQDNIARWAARILGINLIASDWDWAHITENNVRALLENFWNPAEWQSLPFFNGPGERVERVQTIMMAALEEFTQLPDGAALAPLLRDSYIRRQGDATYLARQRHMSRATYYRHLRHAVARFTQFLRQRAQADGLETHNETPS